MTWVLKRTVTESYDINFAALDIVIPTYFSSSSLEHILGMGGGQMAQEAEAWLEGQFDLHDGSVFGDKLFSSRAEDVNVELVFEEDE